MIKKEVSIGKIRSDVRIAMEEIMKSNSFMISTHERVKTGEENIFNIKHSTFRYDFPNDDIIHSFDESVRQIGVRLEPAPIVVKPPKITIKRRPLKIGIMSHFNRMPDSFSPSKAFRNQIKLLQKFGHEVVAFVMEGSTVDLGCEVRPLVTKFKRVKNVVSEEAKQKMIDMLRREITKDFDLIITHDFMIDDCITYREAIKSCGVDVEWLHTARSGLSRMIDFGMPNARYIYLNYADTKDYARKLGVKHSDVRTIFNEKEPNIFFNWNPITNSIVNKLELWDKDIMQVYPVCTTRLGAKGINEVFKVFSTLKRLGKSVGLVIANANGRKRVEQINEHIDYAKELGLVHGEDFLFTSLLEDKDNDTSSQIPNKVVAELFQMSNLFIFPTIAEVGSNILLEASLGKNLLVLNSDLPNLFDFTEDMNTLSFPFTSSKNLHFSSRDQKSYEKLSQDIIGQLASNKMDKQFRYIWKNHNFKNIYKNMYEPILYERIKDNE